MTACPMFDDINQDPDIALAQQILPAWFVARMMTDDWHFGLMLVTGKVLAISSIDRVFMGANDSIWMDVTLSEYDLSMKGLDILNAPTSRRKATVNAAHVVAAFELADT